MAQESWIWIKEYPTKKRPFIISVSKKIVRLSTSRSRIKRLIRSVMQQGGYKPSTNKSWNIIVRRAFPKNFKTEDVKKIIESNLPSDV